MGPSQTIPGILLLWTVATFGDTGISTRMMITDAQMASRAAQPTTWAAITPGKIQTRSATKCTLYLVPHVTVTVQRRAAKQKTRVSSISAKRQGFRGCCNHAGSNLPRAAGRHRPTLGVLARPLLFHAITLCEALGLHACKHVLMQLRYVSFGDTQGNPAPGHSGDLPSAKL